MPILLLPQTCRAELLAHAQAQSPLECVGVLGGGCTLGSWQAAQYFPLPNISPRPEAEYEADPAALVAALRAMRGQGQALAGVFHSHPRGPSGYSAADRAAAAYEVPYLIADLQGGTLRAFLLPEGIEVALQPC